MPSRIAVTYTDHTHEWLAWKALERMGYTRLANGQNNSPAPRTVPLGRTFRCRSHRTEVRDQARTLQLLLAGSSSHGSAAAVAVGQPEPAQPRTAESAVLANRAVGKTTHPERRKFVALHSLV